MANWASRMAMRFNWLISFDVIGFFLFAAGCLSVSCSGVFHAMVDDFDVAPVREDAGDVASALSDVATFLNFFDKIVAMYS